MPVSVLAAHRCDKAAGFVAAPRASVRRSLVFMGLEPASSDLVRRALRLGAALLVYWSVWLAASGTAMGAGEVVPGPVPARVLEVVDGDTIFVRARIWLGQDVEIHVRLAGVDAPEIKGRCPYERRLAQRARDLVAAKVGGAMIRLLDVRRDKYGSRVVARVESASGEDLAGALRRAGLAHAYGGGARRPWCESASAE
jgi:endonuclease YncB( thermonuclease family)